MASPRDAHGGTRGNGSRRAIQDLGRSVPAAGQQYFAVKQVVAVYPNSYDCDLDLVDRRPRIQQAVPLLTALPPDSELIGRRAIASRRTVK